MRRHITGIDHCIILVRDLDRASNTYARLGFTISPRGRHSAKMGTGNHTIMLEKDYFELLGVLEPTELSQKWIELAKAREGLSALALRTDDAAGAATEMRAIGVAASDPLDFSRPVDLPGGGKAEAAFRTTHLPDEAAPHLRLFCCQHLTRDNVWVPSLTTHANTAYGIDHFALVTEAPQAEALPAARIFDAAPRELGPETVSVATGSAPILFLTPSALRQRYAGADFGGIASSGLAVLSLKLRDAAAAAACLRRSGVPFSTTDEGILVPPREACGVLLALRAA
jgi:hypothetical protein